MLSFLFFGFGCAASSDAVPVSLRAAGRFAARVVSAGAIYSAPTGAARLRRWWPGGVFHGGGGCFTAGVCTERALPLTLARLTGRPRRGAAAGAPSAKPGIAPHHGNPGCQCAPLA
ncbi:MAG: hypothetical protein K1V84_08240, partial [Muribaculaceae bacterium]